MDGPGVYHLPEGSGEQGKMEETGYEIICGAPTTLAIKGLMMMMMCVYVYVCVCVSVCVSLCVCVCTCYFFFLQNAGSQLCSRFVFSVR